MRRSVPPGFSRRAARLRRSWWQLQGTWASTSASTAAVGLEADRLGEAQLVIVMTRGHLRDAVTSNPAIWPRCFTLKELVRRGRTIGPRGPHETLETWLARVHEGRTTRELLGADPEDDVEDPMGGSPQDYRNSATEISRLVERLAALIWPDGR